jgi:class 3 adenylate cyclase
MALQLQQSFAALEKANAELEMRVEERTALLREANHQLQDEILERQRSEQTLRSIVEGTASATGNDFFSSLVYHLTTALQVRCSFISECVDFEQRRSSTLAIWTGTDFGANFEYTLSGTPCEQVIQSRCLQYYPEQLQALFPEDQGLVQIEAQSYLGIPLMDASGNLLGHLAVLDDQPMGDEFWNHRRSGEPLVALLSAEIINLGDESCLLAKTTDITERKRAEEALQKSEGSYRELALREELLNRLATQIRNSLELDMILDTAVHQIRNLLQIDSCHFMWFRPDPEQPYWEILKEAKNVALPSLLGCYPLRYVASSPEQLREQLFRMITRVTDDVSTLEDSMERQFFLSLGYTAFLGNPIRIRSGAIGVLYCGHCTGSRHWSKSEVALVQAVADQLAIAISQAELYEQARTAQEQSERLLLNILPQAIAERLKQEQHTIADSFEEVTVMFADIVDFTELSARISPKELLKRLNEIFSTFDRLAQRHGLEKIKTIGDAYMVVGGLPTPRADHAEAIAEMALDMQHEISRFKRDEAEPFLIRIGINSGSVVAGVIGLNKFIYDLWGDTVNTASRMESQGIPGYIQVTATTYERLRGKFLFEERGVLHVKGKGDMNTYFLKRRKTSII